MGDSKQPDWGGDRDRRTFVDTIDGIVVVWIDDDGKLRREMLPWAKCARHVHYRIYQERLDKLKSEVA